MPLRTSRATSVDAALAATLIGALATTAVLILPALRPGYALYLDHIAVPDPARPQWQHLASSEGLRAWPLSGVMWAWSRLLPAWSFQHLVLLGSLLGAGVGAGLVLRRWGWGAAFSGSVLAVANPYVVERLLLGQAGLLLAYAALPWVVIASRQRSSARRVGLALLASALAALTPWGAVVVGAVAVGLVVVRRRAPFEVLAQTIGSVALSLPWLVPALRIPPASADPDGAVAFRLADDVGLGAFVSALTGGGVWSSAAQLDARSGPVGTAVTIIAVVLAVHGVVLLARARRRPAVLLALTWVGIPAVAALLSGPALSLWSQLQVSPALALFRDLHRLLAPSVLALVLLLSIALSRWGVATSRGHGPSRAVLAAVLPVSLGVMFVPGAPDRLQRAYEPRPFSPEWAVALSVMEPPGRVLSLPWQPLRRVSWMPQPFLDPTGRAVGAWTVSDPTLTVTRDGSLITVDDTLPHGGEDADLARRLASASVDPLASELLARSDIRHILVWKDSPGTVPGRPDRWDETFSGTDFDVWSVEGVATG